MALPMADITNQSQDPFILSQEAASVSFSTQCPVSPLQWIQFGTYIESYLPFLLVLFYSWRLLTGLLDFSISL